MATRLQAKAMNEGKGGSLGLAQANFGPRYEQHVQQLQKNLDEVTKKLEEMQRDMDEVR